MSLMRPEDWKPQGVADLECRACEALRETERSVCVTAGAGAGKTEFLAQKATYLLQTGLCPDPKRILAISFKRDAAYTLAERVRRRCPASQARRFVSMTFDAFTKSLLDQFRLAIPAPYTPPANYQISFPSKSDFDEFLDREEIRDINPSQLERAIAQSPLPLATAPLSDRGRKILRTYWDACYAAAPSAAISFPMINRLSDYIIRANPKIRKALQMTYPVVFLDEFQDTTTAQFEFVRAVFDGSGVVFTSVGDDKQRIMGWAGAMPNAFKEFTAAFDARCITLLSNWRSHEELVSIQHIIASRIDPEVEAVVSRKAKSVDGNVSAIWEFDNRGQEVAVLADWIANEIAGDTIEPQDICILVRMKADVIEKELGPVLAERDLILRNLARNVGGVAIQDTLTEDLTDIVLPLLKLGATKRNPDAWAAAQEQFNALYGVVDDDEYSQQKVAAALQGAARSLREYMTANGPKAGLGEILASLAITLVGDNLIRQSVPSYQREQDYTRVKRGVYALLEEAIVGGGSWPEILDRFEGKGQIPLMTIHKSKGMEFHTIVFFGLDSQSWWSLKPNAVEELNSFFVAFTRAEQRAFFTCCNQRGAPIGWLQSLLGEVVPRIDGATI